MNNSALIYEKNPPALEPRKIPSGAPSFKQRNHSSRDVETVKQHHQTVLLKNNLIKLNQEHEELYKQFAQAHTSSEAAKIKLAVYENALKQILSTIDFEKVIQIAETRSMQQREHTIAMHKWSDLV